MRRRRRHDIAVPVAAIAAAGLAVAIGVIAVSGRGGHQVLQPAAVSSSEGVSSSAVNDTCAIIVPAHPLSAKGLATPYQLTGPDGEAPVASGCQMINSVNLGAFVQATILNPRTGALSVYDPLVITAGTTPAVRPAMPRLPEHAIVTIEFGFNGTTLLQQGATPGALAQGSCIDGEPGSPFGQVSFCNGTAFFAKALRMHHTGHLTIPRMTRGRELAASPGSPRAARDCPTTRSFDMVDQDPSDNVTTQYLLNPATGQTAQDNTADRAAMPGAAVLNNGSDNALIDDFLDPALGCTPFMAPNLDNHGVMTTSQALDELYAASDQQQDRALIPENDEMVQGLDGSTDVAKTDLYRAEIGQAPVDSQTDQSSSPVMFCQNLVNIQTPFIAANQAALAAAPSPVPTVGDTLFTFMANRLLQSFDNLSCQDFGLANPVQVVLNGAGAATEATLNTAQQTASY